MSLDRAELLLWSSVIIDGTLATLLLSGLLGRRVPRRWRTVVGGLFLVVLIHFTESLGHATLADQWAQTVSSVTHPIVVVGLVGVAFVLRREVLMPQRLLELAWQGDEARDVYLDGVSAIVATLTPDGVIRHMNKHGLELLGVTEEEAVGSDAFARFVSKERRKRAKEDFLKFCASGGTTGTNLEYPIMTSTGEHVIHWRRSAMLNEAAEVVGVISYGDDVSEQRRMEARSRWESHLLDSVHDSVVVTDSSGVLLYFNQAAHELYGYSREEFTALPSFGWIAPESRPDALQRLQGAVEQEPVLFETESLCRDGDRVPMEVSGQRVEFEGKPAVLSVGRNVAERRHAQELMSQLAFRDPLTGLPNRRLLCDRLAVAIAQLKRNPTALAVLYIDIDNLKAVNDSVGHEAGDRLIKAVGRRLADGIREGDTLGRIGGDEFVVILADIDAPQGAEEAAMRLRDLLAEPLEIDGFAVRTTASIGICLCTPDLTADEAILRADRAMYVVKKAGGNAFRQYEPSMEAAISERFKLKNELADALGRNELELYFQPIVDSQTFEVRAAEALIRWNHPVRGFLPPDVFIRIAEESGLIVPIGRWVLVTACEALASWRRHGIHAPRRICVNLSPVQLLHGDIVRDVLDALANAGIDAGSLEIEVTETAAMEQIDLVMPIFERLRSMGVGLALDDFGTGHSSLERLQRLPITTLKIDKSFVADLCPQSDSHPIVDTILVLAAKLGLDVIAEGVETHCHLEYLQRARCANLQGYLFSRPCDAATFERLIALGAMKIDQASRPVCPGPDRCDLHHGRHAPRREPVGVS